MAHLVRAVGATQQYYPVLHSAFWVEHRLWGRRGDGVSPGEYPAARDGGVLVWAGAVSSFGGAARPSRRLLEPVAEQASEGPAAPPFSERLLLAAFLFALHPVCVESVAWISEQKNTLSTVFYLLAVLVYLGWRKETESRKEEVGRRKYFLATLLFVMALLSKTVTATLPGALLVIIWWQRGRLAWKRDVVPLVPWFALGAASGLFSAWVERTYVGAQGSDFNLSALERGLLAGRAVWFYLGKLVWPADLIFIYPRWAVSSAALGQYLYPVAAVALVAALWLMRKRTRGPLAAILFFLGSLFPVCGFFNLYAFIYSYVADHWQYLPSIGIVVLAAAGWEKGKLKVESWKLKGIPPSNFQLSTYNFWRVAPFPIVAVLGVLTFCQSGMYNDIETFYKRTIAENPGCWMAENNLGIILERAGRLDEAFVHYNRVLQIEPNARAHYNLGTLLREQGKPDEAIVQFQEALRLDPGYADAYNNLGGTLGDLGRSDDAIAQFKLALKVEPNLVGARQNLGIALAQEGKYDEAIAQLQEALRLAPDLAESHVNLGALLRREGRYPEAITEFQRAIELKPDVPETRVYLGTALAVEKRYDEAVAQLREAVRLAPNYAEAHFFLGAALNRIGRPDEARDQFMAALRISPNFAKARESLERLPPPNSTPP
jgi:tetratricopeptide (TPR) repeat protein